MTEINRFKNLDNQGKEQIVLLVKTMSESLGWEILVDYLEIFFIKKLKQDLISKKYKSIEERDSDMFKLEAFLELIKTPKEIIDRFNNDQGGINIKDYM